MENKINNDINLSEENLNDSIDSCSYEILEAATKKAAEVMGLSCEIGLRGGGSSYRIMKNFKDLNSKRPHIAIDPYGDITYHHWENYILPNSGYTNEMKNEALTKLYYWSFKNDYNFIFFPMEDEEFFKRFPDGIPIYNENKEVWDKYSLIFFDGPHTSTIIKNEISFFSERMVVGGLWVFDDIHQYNHMETLDEYIKTFGFEVYDVNDTKISYIKIK